MAGSGGDGIVSAGESLITAAAADATTPFSRKASARKSVVANRPAACVSPPNQY